MFKRLKAWIQWRIISPLQLRMIIPVMKEPEIKNKAHKKLFIRGYDQAILDVLNKFEKYIKTEFYYKTGRANLAWKSSTLDRRQE